IVDEVQTPTLAGVKHEGRLQILTGCSVQRVEHAVAGDEVDRPSTLRIRWANHRSVAAAARAKEPEVSRVGWLRLPAATAATAAAPGRFRIVPVLLPEDLSAVGVERVQIVGNAREEPDLFHAG